MKTPSEFATASAAKTRSSPGPIYAEGTRLIFSRVVSLQPSVTATLDQLGRRAVLVGVTKWCGDVADVGGLPAVGDCWSATAAEIAALKPDLVIGSVPYREPTLAEILKLGVPFFAFAPRSLTEIYRDIAAIGRLFDAAERAEQTIAHMQHEIALVRERVSGLARVRTYCEEWGKPLIVSQDWVRELVEAAGGEFLFEPGSKPSLGEVAAAEPEAVIFSWCGAGARVPVARVLERRGWLDLPAAVQGRVAVVSDECLNTPAPTLIAGLHALAAILHPETCRDLFPHSRVVFAAPHTATHDPAPK